MADATVDLQAAAARQRIPLLEAHPHQDFLSDNPTLQAGLPAWVTAAASALRGRIPLAGVNPFAGEAFYRPAGHARAFYLSSAPAHDSFFADNGRWAPSGVIAFKGFEPLTEDYDELVRKLQFGLVATAAPSTQRRWTEHYTLLENKLPAAMCLDEAESEAAKSVAFQTAHLRKFGELARSPLPLFVFKHSEAVNAKVFSVLERRLSPEGYEHARWVAKNGLGAYVYYYPSPTIRVMELAKRVGAKSFSSWQEDIGKRLETEKIIDSWVRLLVRMMALGYVPGSLATFGKGILCAAQNAVIDGGFVDFDSLVSISTFQNDIVFYDGLYYAFDEAFSFAVLSLLCGLRPRTQYDVVRELVRDLLATKFQRAIDEHVKAGSTIDGRLVDYFKRERSFAATLERLQRYHADEGTTRLDLMRVV